ncbi:hypothetical protein BDA99DRAFT_172190 [Phascolomyces articulosus]|uniref:Uncharacterized protein n=1 Tax=Phascolomyces articulosus TaxID=60185 RepID=A0AAD5JTS8_9FUNG|nr:hypothetical protein BDA99DRAFT_172190 [Phascolomyces articulosus]
MVLCSVDVVLDWMIFPKTFMMQFNWKRMWRNWIFHFMGTPLCRSLVFPPQSHYPSLFYSSEFHFIQSIVDTFSKSILCKDKPTRIQESETEYSHYALWPFLESIASFVSATNTDNITHFRTGETDLKSVSTIKSDIKYNADGVLYLDGSHLELLLLEVSQAHGHSVDKHKHVYDHLKGAYGCIAMLNKIITTYKYGSRELVQNLRVLFLHASGRDDCLRLWIMRPSLNGTVVKFERVLKEELVIDRTRVSPITNIIQFLYKVKLHYDVAVSALNELKNSDDQNSMKKNKDSLVGFLSPAPFKPNRKNNQCAGIAILDPTSEL